MSGAESCRQRPGGGCQKGAGPAGFVVLLSRDPSELQQLSKNSCCQEAQRRHCSRRRFSRAATQPGNQEHVCTVNLLVKLDSYILLISHGCSFPLASQLQVDQIHVWSRDMSARARIRIRAAFFCRHVLGFAVER